eukprot:GHVT01070382.1.p1 GENE.GHVT01070382.1~~GHVT01070382.1.p1  ORF type:complete len:128 (-),score=12.63 GHVT01070382.1:337-720(-)
MMFVDSKVFFRLLLAPGGHRCLLHFGLRGFLLCLGGLGLSLGGLGSWPGSDLLLGLLDSRVSGGLAQVRAFSALLFDVFQRQAHDCLLDASRAAATASTRRFNATLLVHTPPALSPRKFDWLQLLSG